ncbi:rod shape-determining protein RodA [Candidatus Binatia bacterium]|nr:rod shape-determining protein RodA [Candidatus Binatia bacterium]
MLRIDRRLIAHFDWPLLLCVLVLLGAGLTTVLSATHGPSHSASPLAVRQLIFALGGLAAMVAALCFDYRWLERYGYVPYAAALLLLVLTAAIGTSGGGARRWIPIGPFMLQPSEFAKLALIVALARYLHRQTGEGPLSLRAVGVPLLLFAPVALLILKQPDLGTAVAIGLTVGVILLIGGMQLRLVVLVAAIVGPALPFVWTHLKPYQQRRVLTFIDPQADPLGAGYHIIQSKIAIGSGLLHGKGFMQGTQNQLNFLPEQHTDFIFAVFAEEWGFLGSAALLGAYVVLLLRCIVVASRARDAFGTLLAFGLSAGIFCQVFINMAMAMGVLPVVGVTLPFFSYGGSSLLATMIAIGLLMNISMRRFTF